MTNRNLHQIYIYGVNINNAKKYLKSPNQILIKLLFSIMQTRLTTNTVARSTFQREREKLMETQTNKQTERKRNKQKIKKERERERNKHTQKNRHREKYKKK